MDKGGSCGIDRDQYPPSDSGFSLLWSGPQTPGAPVLVLAHGAGAPMDSPFMTRIAEALGERGIRVVRFEFDYMARRREDGRRRPPEPQARLLECWRAVFAEVRRQVPGPLAIGGKSMGGRMASLLADALQPAALVCLGYPFHPAGQPQKLRVEHLAGLRTATLIVQGERDALGNRSEVAGYALSPAIRLHWLAEADHDLTPPKRSPWTAASHLEQAADVVAGFLRETAGT